mmetsp:Transcript_30724/g.79798  ORF Transcript_30724/g.79798 Transcript_30724/m.79798 type:complete len:216 (-) Transcript_30724:15-662(-)
MRPRASFWLRAVLPPTVGRALSPPLVAVDARPRPLMQSGARRVARARVARAPGHQPARMGVARLAAQHLVCRRRLDHATRQLHPRQAAHPDFDDPGPLPARRRLLHPLSQLVLPAAALVRAPRVQLARDPPARLHHELQLPFLAAASHAAAPGARHRLLGRPRARMQAKGPRRVGFVALCHSVPHLPVDLGRYLCHVPVRGPRRWHQLAARRPIH